MNKLQSIQQALNQMNVDPSNKIELYRAHTPRAPCICNIIQLGRNYVDIVVDDLYLNVRRQLCA